MTAFEDKHIRVLVATDVLARGIDFPTLKYVINMDIPEEPTQYLHRAGRKGRAFRAGHVINLVATEEKGLMRSVPCACRRRSILNSCPYSTTLFTLVCASIPGSPCFLERIYVVYGILYWMYVVYRRIERNVVDTGNRKKHEGSAQFERFILPDFDYDVHSHTPEENLAKPKLIKSTFLEEELKHTDAMLDLALALPTVNGSKGSKAALKKVRKFSELKTKIRSPSLSPDAIVAIRKELSSVETELQLLLNVSYCGNFYVVLAVSCTLMLSQLRLIFCSLPF